MDKDGDSQLSPGAGQGEWRGPALSPSPMACRRVTRPLISVSITREDLVPQGNKAGGPPGGRRRSHTHGGDAAQLCCPLPLIRGQRAKPGRSAALSPAEAPREKLPLTSPGLGGARVPGL